MELANEALGQQVWQSLLKAHALVLRMLERDLQEQAELPLTWFGILADLAGTPDGQLRMQALAECAQLSRSGMTRLIDRMEHAGLVRREPCEADRRGYNAIMTRQGRKQLERAVPVVCAGIRQHFAQYLDTSDLDTVEAAMTKVIAAHSDSSTESECLDDG
ncbi:MAG: MarR family transcriptional regulator [Dehalococcoidia bacterium]|nr:MarR family transcriptional regulator [Dehalococcoidia bacterium]